jgi:hypothetical protein
MENQQGKGRNRHTDQVTYCTVLIFCKSLLFQLMFPASGIFRVPNNLRIHNL